MPDQLKLAERLTCNAIALLDIYIRSTGTVNISALHIMFIPSIAQEISRLGVRVSYLALQSYGVMAITSAFGADNPGSTPGGAIWKGRLVGLYHCTANAESFVDTSVQIAPFRFGKLSEWSKELVLRTSKYFVLQRFESFAYRSITLL